MLSFLSVDCRKTLKGIFGAAKMASQSPEIIDVMFIWTWTKIKLTEYYSNIQLKMS
jgi:hypothetical protein